MFLLQLAILEEVTQDLEFLLVSFLLRFREAFEHRLQLSFSHHPHVFQWIKLRQLLISYHGGLALELFEGVQASWSHVHSLAAIATGWTFSRCLYWIYFYF